MAEGCLIRVVDLGRQDGGWWAFLKDMADHVSMLVKSHDVCYAATRLVTFGASHPSRKLRKFVSCGR